MRVCKPRIQEIRIIIYKNMTKGRKIQKSPFDINIWKSFGFSKWFYATLGKKSSSQPFLLAAL